MLYENVTPEDYVERKYCREIFNQINTWFDNDTILYVRSWNQEIFYPLDKKFITIVTSAEGHNYVPKDGKLPNCLGVFMHYYPKIDIRYQYDPEYFVDVKNTYALPLGTTDFFVGDNKVPINNRPINVSFVGQLDPYRRLDFYNHVAKLADRTENSVFQFYQGWNNGIGGEKYSDIMSNTKIALVPCGSASLDTFRFFEAAKCGCVIISDIQNHYEFMKGSPHLEVDNWSYITELIQSLLSGTVHINDLSNATYKFWKKRLSPEAASAFILRKVK